MRRLLYAVIILLFFPATVAIAQHSADTVEVRPPRPPLDRFYIGNGLDGLMFSFANVNYPGFEYFPVMRFSPFLNAGLTFNYNLTRNIGAFTGIDVKNIGFVVHDGYVLKYRTYNVGVPAGIKLGNMLPRKTYIFFGGGLDFPVNYREKRFVLRAAKEKTTEWFSNRTPHMTPYLFAGVSFYDITLKGQYYPLGFFNADYTDEKGVKRYASYDVHIYYLSLGCNLRKRNKLDKPAGTKTITPIEPVDKNL